MSRIIKIKLFIYLFYVLFLSRMVSRPAEVFMQLFLESPAPLHISSAILISTANLMIPV